MSVPVGNAIWVIASLIPSSAMLEDSSVNTFWFNCDAPTDTEATAFIECVRAFYMDIPATGIEPVSQMLGNSVLRTPGYGLLVSARWIEGGVDQIHNEYFQLADFFDGEFDLPSESAICVSYHGIVTGTVADRRTRGRIYVGPLNAGVVETDANGACRPSAATINGLALSASALHSAAHDVDETKNTGWCVYSRALFGLVPIVGGYVDNAFDTQRRRGVAASSRTTW